MMKILLICWLLIGTLLAATDDELRQLAKNFPAMPKSSTDLAPLVGGLPTFSSGSPFNDLQFTTIDTDYIDGENSGNDVFIPVDPSDVIPGANKIKVVRCSLNSDLDANYGAARGDRVILGTAESNQPFFLKGTDQIDNDYVSILHFDYNHGHIQLSGQLSDYQLIFVTTTEGAKTTGWYLFYTAGTSPDLIAFIFPSDVIEPAVSGNEPRVTNPYGLPGATLSLQNPTQFKIAKPVSPTASIPGGVVQLGGRGKDIVYDVTADKDKNIYLVGCTDSNLDLQTDAGNEIFVSKVAPDGQRLWTTEIPTQEGSIIKSAVTDNDYLYACGRTLGALAGYSNAGRWDGILLKLRLSDGVVISTHQWGNAGIDGYGNIILDGEGHLYISGQGSPSGPAANDDAYLVAKHRTSDLSHVWRQIDSINTSSFAASAEAWGGLTYLPSSAPGGSKLIVAGWYMANGANAYAAVYTNLAATAPTRSIDVILTASGTRAEWILDSAVDAQGRIYFVGYSTGGLLNQSLIGEGDAFLVRYDANLTNPIGRQFGTIRSDFARSVEITSDGRVHVLGQTHGNYLAPNADPSGLTGDLFVQSFDTNLNPLGGRQFGTPHDEQASMHLHADKLVIGGVTEGSMVSASHGSLDGFALVLDPNQWQIATDWQGARPLELAIKKEGQSVKLSWPIIPGKSYQMRQSYDLISWQNYGSVMTAPFGHDEISYQVNDSSTLSQFYYVQEF
jgi:hypothetical protein